MIVCAGANADWGLNRLSVFNLHFQCLREISYINGERLGENNIIWHFEKQTSPFINPPTTATGEEKVRAIKLTYSDRLKAEVLHYHQNNAPV